MNAVGVFCTCANELDISRIDQIQVGIGQQSDGVWRIAQTRVWFISWAWK